MKAYKVAGMALVVGLFFVACNNEPKSEAGERKNGYTKVLKSEKDSLFQDVMDGHDVGMAKMGKINGYLKAVNTSLDSTRKTKNGNTQHILLLESVKADLNQAEYSMNRWMEEFKLDSAENNEPVRIAYLKSEKEKVGKIKERILNSVQRADSLYGKKD
jgi:hypothetical protein